MLPPKTKKTRALRRDSEWAFPHFGEQATSHWSVRSEILYFHFGVDCFLDSKRAQLRRKETHCMTLIFDWLVMTLIFDWLFMTLIFDWLVMTLIFDWRVMTLIFDWLVMTLIFD